MRDAPAIQMMTEDDAETINAALCLAFRLLYSEERVVMSEDERVSEERLVEAISKLMPDRELK